MKKPIILVVIICLAMILSSCVGEISEYEQDYINGIKAYETGDYSLAASYFNKIADYKDSGVYLDSIHKKITIETIIETGKTISSEESLNFVYEKALSAYENEDFELALSYFSEIKNYKDSKNFIESIALKISNPSVDSNPQSVETIYETTGTKQTVLSDPNTSSINMGLSKNSQTFLLANVKQNMVDPNTGITLPFTTQTFEIAKESSSNGCYNNSFIINKDGAKLSASIKISNPNNNNTSVSISLSVKDENGNLINQTQSESFEITAGKSRTVNFYGVIPEMGANIGSCDFIIN